MPKELTMEIGGQAVVVLVPQHEVAEPLLEPIPPVENLLLSCTHLVSVPGPNGTRHHILFNPARETEEIIRRWQRSGARHGITVDDRAGRHSCDRAMAVLNVISDYGSMIVTTDYC